MHAETRIGRAVVEILVVDSDPALAATVRATLPTCTRVKSVGDGYQALHAMIDHPPDVVVLEPLLPGIGGNELVRRLRETHPGTPMIVVTHGHEALSALRSLGVSAVLPKPITAETLQTTLAVVLAATD